MCVLPSHSQWFGLYTFAAYVALTRDHILLWAELGSHSATCWHGVALRQAMCCDLSVLGEIWCGLSVYMLLHAVLLLLVLCYVTFRCDVLAFRRTTVLTMRRAQCWDCRQLHTGIAITLYRVFAGATLSCCVSRWCRRRAVFSYIVPCTGVTLCFTQRLRCTKPQHCFSSSVRGLARRQGFGVTFSLFALRYTAAWMCPAPLRCASC